MFYLSNLLTFLLVISPLIIIFKFSKAKKISLDLRKILFFSKKKIRKNNLVSWASVGEIMSIVPLIRRYEKDKSINQILITSSTLSSSKIVKKYNFKKLFINFFLLTIFF